MDSASWTFADWLEDYARYGVVQGISTDCKGFSNRFGLPLFIIKGRSNDVYILTFSGVSVPVTQWRALHRYYANSNQQY